MIQCARCAAANQPTSKYCLTCGSPLPAAAQPAAPAAAPTAPPPAPAPAWGPPGYGGPPPGYGAPPPGAPPQPYPSNPGQNYPPGAPPPQFAGSDAERLRFGSPDGLNPYGATVGPSVGPGGYAPPPAPAPVNPHSHEPSAFAPTAPPVRDEYDPYRAPAQPAPPAQAYNPPAAAPYNPPPAPGYNPPPPPVAYAPQPQQPQYAPQPAAHQAPAYAQPPPPAPAYAQPPAPAYAPQPAAPVPQPGLQANPSRPPPVATGRDPDQVEPGAPRALAGFLVSYEGNDLGAFWPIHQGQNQLGRKGAAPGLDIEIDHPTTSSRHAVLYASARPARLKLEDSGSTNGTFLKDQQLERGKRYEVEDGDVVRFGGFTTIVKLV